ncbi:MAG: cytochrome c biogenesis CcdA family protein [Calditrichia bacterium]
MEQLFTYLTQALYGNFGIALFASFLWGVLSILLSPCHLASIPLVIGYVSAQKKHDRRSVFLSSLMFAVGILVSIALIGLVTISLGRMMGDVGNWGNYLVAGIFLIVGFYLMGVINLNWAAPSAGNFRVDGWIGAFILGIVFGIGLGPCTFAFLAPVLGVVYQMVNSSVLEAVSIIGLFAAGHCLLIVVAGSLAPVVQKYLNWADESKIVTRIRQVSGFLVILAGIYFVLK